MSFALGARPGCAEVVGDGLRRGRRCQGGRPASDGDLVHVDVGRMQEVAGVRPAPRSASALGPPLAVMVVPSSGSTAMSMAGPPATDLSRR